MGRAPVLVVCAIFAAGCSEQDILVYQGRPAQTAEECRAAYEAARQRAANTPVDYSSNASVSGASLGRSMARGMQDSAYRSCLARVANLTTAPGEPGAPLETVSAIPASGPVAQGYPEAANTVVAVSASCPADAPVIYGGTAYCRGN